jgi:hypothetical protein
MRIGDATSPESLREEFPSVSPVAALLTVLGLVPFVLLGLGALGHDPIPAGRMLSALIDYAALVLGFVGAVHWGLALAPTGIGRQSPRAWLILAVVPMLVGWVALNLEPWMALVLLIVGSVATVLAEREANRRGLLPPGYLWLRYGFAVVSVAMLTTVLTLRLLGQTTVF